jgi:hypothetical protein
MLQGGVHPIGETRKSGTLPNAHWPHFSVVRRESPKSLPALFQVLHSRIRGTRLNVPRPYFRKKVQSKNLSGLLQAGDCTT